MKMKNVKKGLRDEKVNEKRLKGVKNFSRIKKK